MFADHQVKWRKLRLATAASEASEMRMRIR